MTPTPPPTPDDKLREDVARAMYATHDEVVRNVRWEDLPAGVAKHEIDYRAWYRSYADTAISIVRAALAPTQQRSLGPCIQTDAPTPSPDDAAVLDEHEGNSHDFRTGKKDKYEYAYRMTRAAVLARMDRRAVIEDEATVERVSRAIEWAYNRSILGHERVNASGERDDFWALAQAAIRALADKETGNG